MSPSTKKLEVKTNRTSFLCGYRNGLYNMELRMQTDNRTTQKTKENNNTVFYNNI